LRVVRGGLVDVVKRSEAGEFEWKSKVFQFFYQVHQSSSNKIPHALSNTLASVPKDRILPTEYNSPELIKKRIKQIFLSIKNFCFFPEEDISLFESTSSTRNDGNLTKPVNPKQFCDDVYLRLMSILYVIPEEQAALATQNRIQQVMEEFEKKYVRPE
jgi:hypothetical protein